MTSSFGNVCAIIGAQWGDEGKGKVVDIVAEHYDVIARACGGANAGHTIVIDSVQHIFHLLPSGCFHEGKPIILGAGMVLHLPTLLEEIEEMKKAGFDVLPRLHISSEAHILFEYHKKLDGVFEEARAKKKGKGIGTTMRGIGPAYQDKAARTGIRMESLDADLTSELKERAESIKEQFGLDIDINVELKNLEDARNVLKGCVTDTVSLIHEYLEGGKSILIEGAQGVLLDLDHGSYPYVTSSSTTISGALQALGLPPKSLESCIGIAKAYCTRVGEGEFPAEASEADGNRIRERGVEYGATTGRPRRCGWLSVPDLLKVVRLNGYTHWNITKLDVLDEEDQIPVMMSDGYQNLPGWKASTRGLTSFDELPENAKKYIQFIEEQTGVPVAFIGTGPGREEMIVKS
ncbi:MAG: adenylosuccinate synthase [Candidatus Peribacteraceae bacterium]|jgi:adenylosuccinate synthase|nr:adenylosuccinate synthase [Candidatus Peribacteraceae bacterium]|tara:strand:+ start:7487 stop:8701 length:1215 start_codon:yes stop_codon:yes gene_type:complete